jgi:selenocysteine-specific elongation factor
VKRHRRNHPQTIAALESLALGSPEELVLIALRRIEPAEAANVVNASGLDRETAREILESLIASGEIVPLTGAGLTGVPLLCSTDGLLETTARLRETLEAYHASSPLRPGMPKEELRGRLGFSSRVFDQLLAYWTGSGIARGVGAVVAFAGHEPRLTAQQEAQTQTFLDGLRSNPYSPPDSSLDEELFAYLEAKGEIVRVADSIAFAADAYKEMVERVTAHIREHGSITLAQVRDMFGTSRKYAQALLEHMDAERITRREGDERVLRHR